MTERIKIPFTDDYSAEYRGLDLYIIALFKVGEQFVALAQADPPARQSHDYSQKIEVDDPVEGELSASESEACESAIKRLRETIDQRLG